MIHIASNRLRALALALAACLVHVSAQADDIDVFVGGSSSGQLPNLLLVLDNSSNWSASLAPDTAIHPTTKQTKFHHERKALGLVMDALGTCAKLPDGTCNPDGSKVGDRLRLGLMMFAETGTNGGYMRSGLRQMTSANRNAFKCMVTGTPITDVVGMTCDPSESPGWVRNGANSDTSGSNQPYGKAMFEAFKYFGGYTSPAYAYKDQQPPGAVNDATNFGPRAYAGWGTDSGSDTGAIRRDFSDNTGTDKNDSVARNMRKAFAATGATYGGAAFSDGSDATYDNSSVEACGRNFVLFISNGNPGVGGDSGGTDAETLLTNVGGNANPITNGGSTVHASLADEFARFLNQTDVNSITGQQNITTMTMAVYDQADASQTSTKEMIKLMNSMANAGGGNYYEATKGEVLVDGILSAINQVLARDSTFVTATLPVNANAQGEFDNQVFLGTFRPSGSGNPRWWGNVKQYRLACMSGAAEDLTCGKDSVVRLVDSSTPPKVIYSVGTSFIAADVTSFWTQTSTFWSNDPKGTSTTPGSDAPDGEFVEKGGAAQRLRTLYAASQTGRKVFTCLPTGNASTGVVGNCAVAALPAFSVGGTGSALTTADKDKFFHSSSPIPAEIPYASKVTYGALAAGDQNAALTNLVNWVRGTDNINPTDEKGPGGTTTVRPSVHGDVVHSRPVAINFGGSTGVLLFYGDNHGHLHAIKGGSDSSTGGDELWSFVAPEFFPKLTRLRANSPALLTPATPGGIDPAPLRKDYMWDGPLSYYRNTSTGTTILYAAARRGGRFIYALNITDPTTPKFLWRIDPTQSNFSALGQTWSTPVVARVSAEVSTDPVLIFGGGYPGSYGDGTQESCEDAPDITTTARDHATGACTYGRGVYVVNAFTGALIKHITGTGVTAQSGDGSAPTTTDMNFAIPSDVSVLDTNADGKADRAYVGDLGGRVWRIELSSTSTSDWKAYLLGETTTSSTLDKKMFFSPTTVTQTDYTMVMVGTGDREKPLKSTSANTDGFYAFRDPVRGFMKSTIAWSKRVEADLCDVRVSDECRADPQGWKILLDASEKVINSPRVAFGVANFATNVPKASTANQCLNTGEARSYQMYFDTGESAFTSGNFYIPIETGGLAPTTFTGVVNINGNSVAVVIGGGIGDSGAGGGSGCKPSPTSSCAGESTPPTVRTKRYWYKKKD